MGLSAAGIVVIHKLLVETYKKLDEIEKRELQKAE